MGEEVVAVALQVVADEIGVVAVGDKADALGEERILRRDLLQPDGTRLARDLGDAGEFVDQFARADRVRSENANLMPSGRPCSIAASGNRIRVAAIEPPKMMMMAWMS